MVLIIDDDVAVRTSLVLLLKQQGMAAEVAEEPLAALEKIAQLRPTLVLLDLNFSLDTSGREGMELLEKIRAKEPALPIVLITGWGSIALAVQGMKLGANDFVTKPWQNEQLIQTIRTLLQLNKAKQAPQSRKQLDEQFAFRQLIGEDPAVLRVLETIGRVAPTDAPVLIMGESGTGKELVAEAIHQNSMRKNKPFVKVNLGGISSSLFESEMFGHVRGAFTDARFDRTGRFELANKGTIFLDEIGDLDPASQVKLLRVLQDKTYEVLGSSRSRFADVRVVCATNKNLNDMVAKGGFREDLLYRINLITLRLPALRERAGDIPLLVNSFIANLREIYQRPGVSVAPSAMKWLQKLPLPGNIRQLKNLVERTILVSGNDQLEIEDFNRQLELSPASEGNLRLPGVGTITLEELEVEMIRRAMSFHRNSISKAALSLGITRSSLYRRLEKYNIAYDEAED